MLDNDDVTLALQFFFLLHRFRQTVECPLRNYYLEKQASLPETQTGTLGLYKNDFKGTNQYNGRTLSEAFATKVT